MKPILHSKWTGILFFCFFCQSLSAQNTVGLLSNQEGKSWPGYNLIYPHNQPTVYLIDNCGRLINKWTDNKEYRPGNTVYLLENGNLVRAKRLNNSINDPIWAGGGGATVEILSWDNNLLYTYTLNNTLFRLHHDVVPMPNGHILMIAWAKKTKEEAIRAGRNPDLLPGGELWSEAVLEWDPNADSIVWEWHLWDHLVQDVDPKKNNYGVVGDHPELIDINYDEHDGHQDWLHINSIDYNAALDQFLLCVPYFNEIWVIDHSTTKAEAATHKGGRSGKGGDILHRWGNPVTYRQGTLQDKTLFFQHGAKWTNPKAGPGEPGFARVSVYNNRVNFDNSAAVSYIPPFDTATWSYTLTGSRFGPAAFDEVRIHPTQLNKALSNSFSSVQILPNGNWLILSGRWGYAFELTPDNEVVWAYLVPLKNGAPVSQGDLISIVDNLTFRMDRYPLDYAGLKDKDLRPDGYIENNPNTGFCGLTVATRDVFGDAALHVFPNPVTHILTIERSVEQMQPASLFDVTGRPVRHFNLYGRKMELYVGDLPAGFYLLRIGQQALKLLVQRP